MSKICSVVLLTLVSFILPLKHIEKGYLIASDVKIEGKLVDGQCFPYAVSLSQHLQSVGIHGRLVFLSWKILQAPPDGWNGSGRHVFVEYDDGGKRWIADNEHLYPIPVFSSSADEWVRALDYDADPRYKTVKTVDQTLSSLTVW